ncbi:MAG: alpha/beta fold hydrolase [Planctomycetota bacterium]
MSIKKSQHIVNVFLPLQFHKGREKSGQCDGIGAPPEQLYPRLSAPTLILKADAEQESRKKHIEIANLLPNGKLVHIDGATHLVRQDKPVETERQIRSFLA